jgi:hypothetical protein
MKCPRGQAESPPSANFCLECGTPFGRVEAREEQAATAEILAAISRSPADLPPVLQAVVQNASRLCGAANVSLYHVEGECLRGLSARRRHREHRRPRLFDR